MSHGSDNIPNEMPHKFDLHDDCGLLGHGELDYIRTGGVIQGQLIVYDKENIEIGRLHMSPNGLSYSMPDPDFTIDPDSHMPKFGDGRIEMRVVRESSETPITFTQDDTTFQDNTAIALAFAIARHPTAALDAINAIAKLCPDTEPKITCTRKLAGSQHNTLGTATLTYGREHMQFVEKLPFADADPHTVQTDRLIIGDIMMEDKNGKMIAKLSFTREGLRYSYPSDAEDRKWLTIPIRKVLSDRELLFTADDNNFQDQIFPMLAFTIIEHHANPKEVERQLRMTVQSTTGHGQAFSLPPVEEDGRDGGPPEPRSRWS